MDLSLAAIAFVSVWMALLTVVVLMLVRQTAILTVRQERVGSSTAQLDDDGLAIGAPLPRSLLDIVPSAEATALVVLSAICAPCREFAGRLGKSRLDGHVIALVAGRAELATPLVSLLPQSMTVIQDPQASALVKELATSSTPFAIVVAGGTVVAKRYLHDVDDLRSVLEARGNGVLIPREVAQARA